MTTSILIPFRGDNGQRDRLWAYCKQLWEALPYELCIGTDTGSGPFNIAMAFNDAHAKATGDKLILYGADHLPDRERIEWAIEQLDHHPWAALYATTSGYDEDATESILAGHHPDDLPLTLLFPFCIPIIGIRQDAWIPLDERFEGWGSEDTAWRLMLRSIYGDTPEPTGTLRALWHEKAPQDHAQANYDLLGEYITADNTGTMREYLNTLGTS